MRWASCWRHAAMFAPVRLPLPPVATDQPARLFVAAQRCATAWLRRLAFTLARPAVTPTTVDWIIVVVSIIVSFLPAIGRSKSGARMPSRIPPRFWRSSSESSTGWT